MRFYTYATMQYDGGIDFWIKSRNILYMLKVERNFSEYTLKSYHDDLVQFNNF